METFKYVYSLVFCKHGEWSERKRKKRVEKRRWKCIPFLKDEMNEKGKMINCLMLTRDQRKSWNFSRRWEGSSPPKDGPVLLGSTVCYSPLYDWIQLLLAVRSKWGRNNLCNILTKLKDERRLYKIINLARKSRTCLSPEKTLIKASVISYVVLWDRQDMEQNAKWLP